MTDDSRREALKPCDHDWREYESQFCNEWRTDVVCTKCRTYGEKEYATGEITWPTT